jgi:hypothetical protein
MIPWTGTTGVAIPRVYSSLSRRTTVPLTPPLHQFSSVLSNLCRQNGRLPKVDRSIHSTRNVCRTLSCFDTSDNHCFGIDHKQRLVSSRFNKIFVVISVSCTNEQEPAFYRAVATPYRVSMSFSRETGSSFIPCQVAETLFNNLSNREPARCTTSNSDSSNSSSSTAVCRWLP